MSMKATLKRIGDGNNNLFDVLIEDNFNFYPNWHYHPQYEIMLILESTGTRYVGDSITSFQAGDITIIGSNIPHLFRNDVEYFDRTTNHKSKAIVLYFSNDFVNGDFFNFREMKVIGRLLDLSKRGILIQGRTKSEIAERLNKIVTEDGAVRLIDFIALLYYIASESEYKILSSIDFANRINNENLTKINKVFDYILNNFRGNISLEDVSKIANMSVANFCKYFKSHTNKTLVTFLNEIRIGYACRLLIEKKDLSISEICFECGFNNLTNFNIQFKKYKKMTPRSYRELYSISTLNSDMPLLM